MVNHFGIKISESKYGLKLTRDNYAIVNNKSSFSSLMKSCNYANKKDRIYSDEWCNEHLKNCLENYDLNMEYFSLLDHDDFNKELDKFLKNNRSFTEVFDLNLYDGKSGYYIMVFDEYCQVYIGTTDDIKKRIRQHWSKRKSFDRLLFPIGAVDSSILSIDSFMAFDTTRIFAYTTIRTYDREDEFINQFSAEFVSNRIAGGKITYGLPQAIDMMKKRKLK